MNSLYKNKSIERIVRGVNVVSCMTLISTFVMLYGFYKPVLPGALLHSVQLVVFFALIGEKVVRLFNATTKREYLRQNWFEIPLFFILLITYYGAGKWFAVGHRADAILLAITSYLVLQLIVKVCRGMVELAASGQDPARTLIGVFVLLILVGAGLLMLPRSHNMESLSFTDAVFTATSATCVTGLVVVDTGRDFKMMGQVIILTLIQLGGLGIVIFGAVFALFLGQALSVRESVAMQDLLNAQTLGKIGQLITFIFGGTLLIEAVGAVAMYPMWHHAAGATATSHHPWFCSVFHAISAFCNAGFSLNSDSLMHYRKSWGVFAVICPLIVIGGLGFGVLNNLVMVVVDKFKRFIKVRISPNSRMNLGVPKRIQLQTKIVLMMSLLLILIGTFALMIFEHYSPLAQHDSRFTSALFQSITARTAGFNTVDIAAMSDASKFILIMLMFVGGSPASTAGGIKTITLAVVLMVALATLTKRPEVEMFKRSIKAPVVGRAVTVLVLFFVILLLSTMALIITERNAMGFDTGDIFFEAASALGTVGLSTGLTGVLTTAGKWIIIVTMLIGRLGPLTLVTAMTFNVRSVQYDYPTEPIVVG